MTSNPTTYQVEMHECGGAARIVHTVEASSPETAEFYAYRLMIPTTGLARAIDQITSTRWEIVSVTPV